MREWLWVAIVGSAMTLIPGTARAQAPAAVVTGTIRTNDYFYYFEPPGLYGTSYGVASYGVPRGYSAFASPFGVGYGYGYPPYGLIPSRYGSGLWRPGFAAPGYVYGTAAPYQTVYGASPYLTWPVPSLAGSTMPLPSIGVYAPGFGSTGPMSW
jgi:hypothetical protein